MNYIIKKAVNLNGQDMMLPPLDIDFARRTISLTGEINEDIATLMNLIVTIPLNFISSALTNKKQYV